MARRNRKPHRPHPRRSTSPPADARTPRRGDTGTTATATSGGFWALRPILRAVLVFGICMVAFYIFEATALFQDTVFPAYLRFNAHVSAAIVNVFGENASVQGTSIASPAFAVDIRRGCDAVEPSALCIAAVLALPVAFWRRLVGIAVGTLLLMVVNQIRIVSLYYVGARWPAAFEVMHLDVWQAAFILLVIVYWAVWARWAKPTPGKQHVPA